MKVTRNIAGGIVLFTLAAAPSFAQDTVKEGAEKTKDAVVDAGKAVAGTTKAALSKTGDVITDGWITTRIHERFIGEGLLKDSDISVDSTKHVVTLTGTVTGRAGRTRAATIAKETEGVHRVKNRLTVGPKKA